MKDITKIRFDALAAYCRLPGTTLAAEEVRWLQAHDEALLIVIVRDRVDSDYAAIVLARDLMERYRHVQMTSFVESIEDALAAAPACVERVFVDLERQRSQGDERGAPLDFFTPVTPEVRQSDVFRKLTSLEGYSPALEIVKPMMRWFEDVDGNFIEQFQTTGTDARLWELYIFAMLVEAEFALDRSAAAPDFVASGIHGELCIEATTINPSRDSRGAIIAPPSFETLEEKFAYLRQYMPIRFSSALKRKLEMRYWESPAVRGRPLLFAVQDFHAPMSMLRTRSALETYLYGLTWDSYSDANGLLVVVPKLVESHRWGKKVVQSGFFAQTDADNISAVIWNSGATISKFDRIGVLAGFGSKRVRLTRIGTVLDHDPNASKPRDFMLDVNAEGYAESWIEGLDVYHNPNAKHPLDPDMLPGASHHFVLPDGQMESFSPEWHPLSSRTLIAIDDVPGIRPEP